MLSSCSGLEGQSLLSPMLPLVRGMSVNICFFKQKGGSSTGFFCGLLQSQDLSNSEDKVSHSRHFFFLQGHLQRSHLQLCQGDLVEALW